MGGGAGWSPSGGCIAAVAVKGWGLGGVSPGLRLLQAVPHRPACFINSVPFHRCTAGNYCPKRIRPTVRAKESPKPLTLLHLSHVTSSTHSQISLSTNVKLNSRLIFNKSSHSLLHILRVLHGMFTYRLLPKRVPESEAMGLGFMGGRH